MKEPKQPSEEELKLSKKRKGEPPLLPVEAVFFELGYSQRTIQNYIKLSQKDMHLAEIYRLAIDHIEILPIRHELINPLQTKIDGRGRILVDVVLEKKRGVSLSEIKRLMKIHGKPGRRRFLSGQIEAVKLPSLIRKTVRIQTARPVSPALDKSVATIKADVESLSRLQLRPALDGRGVIVGIVDVEGCDIYHPNFIKNNGTRLLYLWDQNGTRSRNKPSPRDYDYGVEYSQARINEALARAQDPANDTITKKEEAVYSNLGYRPLDAAHGTHVMDIAAGSSSRYPGVAPGADLIFVHFGKPTNPREEELRNIGSTNRLLDAVQYIFEKAGNRPVVINISVAGNGGSHDGTSPVESAFDELLRRSGRAIVIAAGNTFSQKLHTAGTIRPNASHEIQWNIQDKKNREWDMRQELEIWYDKNARLKVEVLDPDNNSYGACRLGERHTTLSGRSSIPSVLISHERPTSGDDENHINIFIANDDPSIQTGPWKIRLSLDPSTAGNNTNVTFHAWIESYGTSHSEFVIRPDQQRDEYTLHTLNTIANGESSIVVGSYNSDSASLPTSTFSSAGPSRHRRSIAKPDVCAPGEAIFAARATDPGGIMKSGTSQAAPHVTGVIALLFQAAQQRRNSSSLLSIREIRRILVETVDPKPARGRSVNHDPQSGFGRVNAMDALLKLLGP